MTFTMLKGSLKGRLYDLYHAKKEVSKVGFMTFTMVKGSLKDRHYDLYHAKR